MIPKTIHYCWYGRGAKSQVIEMCIKSWKEFCPDYKIIEWNEDNSPMNIPWVRDAYKHRKFAFVADYMRFYILYNHGGIYMDTDMLLIRSIDYFLDNVSFIGREDAYNASMGIIGAIKHCDFCRQCLDFYDKALFDVVHPPIITRFISPQLLSDGFAEVDETQRLSNGLVVYKSDYFYPIHYTQDFMLENVMDYARPDTYGIHLWNKSWTDEFQLLAKRKWKQGYLEALRHIRRTPLLPFSYWKKLIKYTGNYLGIWNR